MSTPVPRAARITLTAATLLLPVSVQLLLNSAWSPDLPDLLPSHWSGAGPADGFTEAAALYRTCLILAMICTALGLAALIPRTLPPGVRRGVVGIAASVAACATATWAVSAGLTLLAGDPRTVRLGAGFLVVMLAIIYGLLPAILLPREAAATPARSRPEQPLPAPSGDVSSLSVRMISPGMLALGLAVPAVLIPVTLGTSASGALLPVALLAAALILAFAAVRVRADRDGLRITSVLFRFPVQLIPAERIASATAETILPRDWGGWGYRILSGRSAIILRAGPALLITRGNGRLFAVTVDGAPALAAILESARPAASPEAEAPRPRTP